MNFIGLFLRVLDRYAPVKRIHCGGKQVRKKWWREEIFEKMCKRLFKRAVSKIDEVVSVIKQYKTNYYSEKIYG